MQQPYQARHGAGITPVDPALLNRPIDYLHAVHLCERELCALLERIAARGHARTDEIAAARGFLSGDLPAHLEDEEQDLFPLLRLRCEAEDEIDRLLDRLQDDHRHARPDARAVLDILRAPSRLSPRATGVLRRFADHARRHLILENAILIPFARLRLTGADLDTLRASMRRRRGLATPLD
jgi:hemerythrin-like domain-containing protein